MLYRKDKKMNHILLVLYVCISNLFVFLLRLGIFLLLG